MAADFDLDLDSVLAGLKPFQLRTVEHVFRRLYLDDPPTHRFLVADEVGLGKTMVARALIAKAVDHLSRKGQIRRIDVIYICSNAAIAKQNLNRLNLFKNQQLQFSTRLTLLPIQLRQLRRHKVNFVSFTPGTALDLKSKGGLAKERLMLFFMLRGKLGVRRNGLSRILRGSVERLNWKHMITRFEQEDAARIDPGVHKRFVRALLRNRDLHARVHALAHELDGLRGQPSIELRRERRNIVGELRELLATTCLDSLEPDLIILDEFQRFRNLLEVEDPDDAAQLARSLLRYRDSGAAARVVLLSATPYRMLSLSGADDENHYADFLHTLRFLLEDTGVTIEEIEADIQDLRRAIFGIDTSAERALAARKSVEEKLRKVMVRTERVGATIAHDAMVEERLIDCSVGSGDLEHAVAVGRVAASLKAADVIEYWKSSPYLLNLMRDYDLKRRLDAARARPSDETLRALNTAAHFWITKSTTERYRQIDPGNSRLRALMKETLDEGQWRWLWMPPSLPYWKPAGPYEHASNTTKALVFSCWNVVPDAISAILSYEAERRMLKDDPERIRYSDLYARRKPLLRFHVDAEERPNSMNALALLYPCPTLAESLDPLSLALNAGEGTPTRDEIFASAKQAVERCLRRAGIPIDRRTSDGRSDQRWYWAAMARLDATNSRELDPWITERDGWLTAMLHAESEEGHLGFDVHVDHFAEALEGKLDLGPPPHDLLDVVTENALAGPAVCALRALSRVTGHTNLRSPEILTAAATIAEGLRSLYNTPFVSVMLRAGQGDTPYWQVVSRYGIDGNLQAVLDEYLHVLRDSLGLTGHHDAKKAATDIAAAAYEALALRTSRVSLDEISVNGGRIKMDPFNLRTRFALRFAEIKDDAGKSLVRASAVREAFNSPFPPFVLATTSVGQEGLDFHPYCHDIYHWNLPSNPVDFEQREGRIHRYKGHAVRKNVARAVGLSGLGRAWDRRYDPWDQLFELAVGQVDPALNHAAAGLVPFWVFETEGGTRVRRHVPLLTLSRERRQLAQLKRGLAVYRMVFGQPRQGELLEFLERRIGDDGAELLAKLQINLTPASV